MSIFNQEKILYTREWTKEMDTSFIKKLEAEVAAGRYRAGSDSSRVIRAAMEELNSRMGKNFTYEKYLEQFRKLRRRFRVYSDILSHRGVFVDEVSNYVFYDADAWEEISKVDRLVVAYRTRGDPEIGALCKIFGEEDDSVGFFDLQDLTHLSSNLQGLSDVQKYQFPPYGFDDQLSSSFWSHAALPSSQGECNTSSSVPQDCLDVGASDAREMKHALSKAKSNNNDKNSRS